MVMQGDTIGKCDECLSSNSQITTGFAAKLAAVTDLPLAKPAEPDKLTSRYNVKSADASYVSAPGQPQPGMALNLNLTNSAPG